MTTLRAALERFKPAAGVRTHLLAGALIWTGVGTALAAVGLHWCLGAAWASAVLLVAAGLVLGIVKGRFVLSRAARRNADRVIARGDGKCLGGFLSWKSWLIVPVMAGAGVALRHSAIPRPVLGVLYVGIGAALLAGSVPLWKARASLAGEQGFEPR